jgi:hypothetical protein
LEDLHRDDPPTFQTHPSDYSRLLPLTDRLSVSLMDLLLREHWWHDERLVVHGELRQEEIADLAGRFEELALSSAVPCHEWIGRAAKFTLRGRTSQALHALVPTLPRRWFP